MSKLADELGAQYATQQAAALRGDHVARTIATDWLHKIADSHWHEIIIALRATQTSRDKEPETAFNISAESIQRFIEKERAAG